MRVHERFSLRSCQNHAWPWVASNPDSWRLNYITHFSHFNNNAKFLILTVVLSTGLPTILSVMTVLQLLGNGLTIFLILNNRRLRTHGSVFMLTLALSDFISGVNSPFGTYMEQPGRIEWGLPEFFCTVLESVSPHIPSYVERTCLVV